MSESAGVQRAKAAVAARFPSVSTAGQVRNCRKIAGSSRWSQHAYGNAWDIFAPVSTLHEVYAFLAANRSSLGIATLCWQGNGPCSAADHQDHIHVDFAPTRTGTPACAGGSDGDGTTGGGPLVDAAVGAAANVAARIASALTGAGMGDDQADTEATGIAERIAAGGASALAGVVRQLVSAGVTPERAAELAAGAVADVHAAGAGARDAFGATQAGTLAQVSQLAGWMLDRDNWVRTAMIVGGVLLAIVALLIINRDALAGAVAGASAGPAGATLGAATAA